MKKRTYKRRSEQVWAEVRRDYLAGMPAEDAARLHDVTVSALRARAVRQGWSRYLHVQPAPDGPEAPSDDPRPALPPLDLAPDQTHDSMDAEADEEADAEAEAGDPADLARAATLASGQAMRAGHSTQAHALASLAERYRKLAGREDARRKPLTPDTAPLQLVLDIFAMDRGAMNDRFAVDPDNVGVDPVKTAYWDIRNAEFRQSHDMWEVILRRRFAQERWTAALEAQLKAHGLDLPEDTEAERRLREGLDVISTRGRMTREDWEAIETW